MLLPSPSGLQVRERLGEKSEDLECDGHQNKQMIRIRLLPRVLADKLIINKS